MTALEDQMAVFPPAGKTQALGWHAGEYIGFGLSVLVAVVIMVTAPGGDGIAASIVVLVLALVVYFAPIGPGGERIAPLIPSWFRYAGRYLAGSLNTTFSLREGLATTDYTGTDQPLPRFVGRVSLSSFELAGAPVGVLVDSVGSWPWSVRYNVVVRIASEAQFVLQDPTQQRFLLEQWRSVQEALGSGKSGVTRFSLMPMVTAYQPGDTSHFARDSDFADPDSEVAWRFKALQALLHGYDNDRRYYLVIQIGGGFKSWRRSRRYGSQRAGYEAMLAAELQDLRSGLEGAELRLAEVLGPQALSLLTKRHLDHFAGATVSPLERLPEGEVYGPIWHVSHLSESWTHLRLDETWASTFMITGWPQRPVGANFMTPLMLLGGMNYRVAITLKPTDPKKTRLLSQIELTNAEAGIEERLAKGRVVTARQHRRAEAARTRDEEMASGHTRLEMVGYVTVLAASEDELKEHTARLRQVAGEARIVLGSCYGVQREAFTATMPLCRGL